jgi:hypothetical protein
MVIDVKSVFIEVNILDSMIFMFDRTQLSNFAGNKKQCPVNMSIGNQSSKICQIPLTCTVVMVTLLPIPIRNSNIPLQQVDEQRQAH